MSVTKSKICYVLACGLVVMLLSGCGKALRGTPQRVAGPSAGAAEPALPHGLPGRYTVKGVNPDGTSYEGQLDIIKRDEVYQFRWQVGRLYDGIGIEHGGVVAVSFSDEEDGQGCGVVNYRLRASGTLEGKWGYWGINRSGTETAARSGGAGSLAGEYTTNGRGYDGQKYTGALSIRPTGTGYKLKWDNGDEGFGLRQGQNLVSGVGVRGCNYVAYQIKPDGSLSGIWGGYGADQPGREEVMR